MIERLQRLERLGILECEVFDDTRYDGGQWEPVPLADVSSIGFKNRQSIKLADLPDGDVMFTVPLASGSDYSGSTVERSNFEALQERFPQDWIKEMVGGYRSYGIAVDLRAFLVADGADEMLDILDRLADYPLVDEEHLSQLEFDGSVEAWEAWANTDFKRELEELFDVELDYSQPPAPEKPAPEFYQRALFHVDRLPKLPELAPTGEGFAQLFERARDRANVYWYCEGYGHDMVIDVSRVAESVLLAELAPFIVETLE